MIWIGNKTESCLIGIGISIVAASVWLSWISSSFDLNVPVEQRPVVAVVAVLVASSIAWMSACWLASRLNAQSQTRILWWIVGLGIAARIVLIGSTPILEIDIYRYLWDGNVTASGGDPYKYAPNEFNQFLQLPSFSRSAEERDWINDFSSKQDESLQQTLQILSYHFGEFTTPYPPVSQLVFAVADHCTPQGSSLKTRVVIMKALLVLFDVATGLVLILILRSLKLPNTTCIVWFWSPLVLKEFANGGHLDSIAIFFCATFVLFALKQISNPNRRLDYAIIAAVFLSLGIAAKIYPAVLFPLWAVVTAWQLGTKAFWPLCALLVVTGLLLFPISRSVNEYAGARNSSLPKPGILAFAESWQMNDLLFMVAAENLKPESIAAEGEVDTPWFVFVPESWRNELSTEHAFSRVRKLTLALMFLLIMWLSWRWIGTSEALQPQFFVQCVFLTLAWFWFLSPTQNPWYWCWALPFVPFARSKIWYAVATMTLLYYLRPWFSFNKLNIAGFDHFVPFIEFGPILLLLFATFLRSGLSRTELEGKMQVGERLKI